MKLLVLLLSLVLIHFLPIIKIKANALFNGYVQLWLQPFQRQHWFQSVAGPIAVAIIPIIVVLLTRNLLISDFVVSLIVVCLCLSITDHYTPSYMTPPHALANVNSATQPNEVWRVNYRLVTPIFWYLFLGGAGLLLYTIFLYAAFCNSMPQWQKLAAKIYEIVAWLPCRLLGFAYAISGQMKPALKAWGEWLMLDYRANHAFLLMCAQAAHSPKPDVSIDNSYQHLLRDAQIVLLGLFAVVNMLVTLLSN